MAFDFSAPAVMWTTGALYGLVRGHPTFREARRRRKAAERLPEPQRSRVRAVAIGLAGSEGIRMTIQTVILLVGVAVMFLPIMRFARVIGDSVTGALVAIPWLLDIQTEIARWTYRKSQAGRTT